jgi:hypothetical protein
VIDGIALACALAGAHESAGATTATTAPSGGAAPAPTSAASPDAARRVAILGPADAPAAMQLAAELQLLGFEVVHAPAVASTGAHALRELARELDVAAAIFVDPRGAEVDLWVVDRVTGKTVLRSLAVDEPDPQAAARVAAVRAIDLLRASLRELEDRRGTPAAEVPASTPVRRAIRPTTRRFALAVGPAVAGSAGGLGPTAHAVLAFQAMPHRVFGVGLRAFVPIVGARTVAAAGSARVHVGWIAIGPRFALARPDRLVQPTLGVAIGPAIVGMRGEARPPFVGRRDVVTSAIAEVDVAVAFAVHSRLRVWLDGSIGLAMPRTGVRIGDRRSATWGWPVGAAVLGVQVVL